MPLGLLPGWIIPWFFQYVPGFTEEKFARIQEWYAEWDGPGLSRRFLPNPLQNIYYRKRVLGMTLLPFILASAVSRIALLSGGRIGSQIWGTHEGKNRQAL